MTDDRKSDTNAGHRQPGHSEDESKGTRPSLRIKIGSQRDPAPVSEVDEPEASSPLVESAPVESDASPTESSSPSSEPVQQDETPPAAASFEEPPISTTPDYLANDPNAPTRSPRISDELSREIDDALGGMSLDQLMGEGPTSAPSSDGGEVELDARISATVIKTDRESVFFSLGDQNQGIASLKQFSDVPQPGEKINVVPTRFLADDSLYELVVPGASVEVQDWSDLSEGVVVTAKVTGHNKGGLECEVNRIRGFMPVSQISLFRVEDLEPYVGQTLQCVVTEANPERRNLVISHRAVLEREKEAAREKLLGELEVGQTRDGVVRRIQDFGAFVDIGGVDGLVHISQLSWDRIAHPSEVVEEGQSIKVRIEKIDPASGKIGLSYRDLLDHPWQDADSKYPVGTILDGTVSKVMQFGAFVRVAMGIEGLVHISELAHHRVQRTSSVVQEGKEVKVKVLSVDPAAQKMSLSIKAVTVQPEVEATEATEDEDDAPAAPNVKPTSNEPLKGGLNRDSGGEQFGLNW